MINLVGLYGPSRSGKDETARILVEEFGFEQRAQAAAIRKILLGLNPLIQDDSGKILSMQSLFYYCNEDWNIVKANSREATDYMIRLGQTCRDVIGLDVWLNTALPSNEPVAMIVPFPKIVISDVRQPNEYEAIRKRGGQVWKINRLGVEFRAMDGLLDHLEFDAVVNNNGTLDDLRTIVKLAMGDW